MQNDNKIEKRTICNDDSMIKLLLHGVTLRVILFSNYLLNDISKIKINFLIYCNAYEKD